MTFTINVTTPLDILYNVGTLTNHMFWPFMLIATFGIMIGTLKINNTWEDSFASTTFFTGVIGTLLGLMTLLNAYETMITLAMAFIGAGMLLWKRHQV